LIDWFYIICTATAMQDEHLVLRLIKKI